MSPFIAKEGAFWLDCVLLGIAMALVYDCLRVFRRVVPHAGFWISLEDLLYWAFVSFRFFGLLYSENNGSLRWFSVAGAFLGMALFEKTAGPVFVRAVSSVFLRMMELAAKAGINVPETRTLSYGDGFHTFLSKRFDRDKQKRIHIASALCLLGWKNSDDASFIDIAELISQYSVSANKDLQELYRRIVFSALINNTDNHLRNHSFLLAPNGWKLSPAYDMNPSIHGRTSVLAIDEGIHAFSMEAIKETAVFYNLSDKQAKDIIEEVQDTVSGWERCARQHGLSKEIPLLRSAFAL